MATKKQQEEYTLESAFSKLNDIVKQLDSGTQSLEEAFASYAEGMEMIRLCNAKIDKVEKQCLVIRESGEDHELERTDERKSCADRSYHRSVSAGGKGISEDDF